MSLLSHMFSMLHFHYTQNRNSESAAYFRGSYFHSKYTNHWLESLQEKNLVLATANGWRYCSFRDKYDSIDDNQSNSNVIFRIIQSCTPFYIFTLVSISFPRNKLWKLYYFYWNLFQWGGMNAARNSVEECLPIEVGPPFAVERYLREHHSKS